MAGGDNYREMRWFRPWVEEGGFALVEFILPTII